MANNFDSDNDLKYRIDEMAQYYDISIRKLEERCGLKRGNISNMTGALGSDKLSKIFDAFPNISWEWFLNGRGSMLKTNSAKELNYADPKSSSSNHHANKVNTNQENIQINIPQTQEFLCRKVRDKIIERQAIPLYDITAAASIVQVMQGNHTDIPIENIIIPRAPHCDGAVSITGDSMAPLLKSGDIVAYREIHDIPHGFIWGEMYLIAFDIDGDWHVVIKYVHPGATPDSIKLVSENPRHADKIIPLSTIRAVALVKLSIRFQSH